jgi:hypothetical protein
MSPANAERGCFPTGPSRNCCDKSSYYSSDSCNKKEYSIEEIASISRELSFNDPFIVNKFDKAEERTGTPLDRNVELLVFNPLWKK